VVSSLLISTSLQKFANSFEVYSPPLSGLSILMLGSKDVLKYNLYASSKGRRWHKCFTCRLRRFLPSVFNTRPPEMQPLQRDNNRNKRNNNRSIQMNNKRNNNRDKGTTVVILGRTNVVLIEL
jgi:hypothetical protein